MNLRGIGLALLLCVGADAAWRWTAVAEGRNDPLPAFVAPSSAPVASANGSTPGLVSDGPTPATDAGLPTRAPRCSEWRTVQQGRLPMPEGVPAAHASTLVALAPTDTRSPLALAAFWFAGSRESAPDVGIATSRWPDATPPGRDAWQPAQWAVTRDSLQRDLGVAVRRIGNPVAWRDAQGQLHLYVVATGLGGWAASRVVHVRERANGSFEAERILPLMPLVAWLNTSTLVRAVPQPRVDGGALLPMYFELGIKYGLAVEVGPRGELRDLRRLTRRHDALQPTVVALSGERAWAFMRDSGPTSRVAVSETRDGGRHWQDQPEVAQGNPDSSLAAVALPGGEVWVAHNPLDARRRALRLSRVDALSGDWPGQTVVQGPPGSEFSYPSLLAWPTSDGGTELWLSYTDQREAIAYARLQRRCEERSR